MKRFKKLGKESGAYTVMTAILMTVLVAFLAFSVDIGYHYFRAAQLQNAADAAATAVAANLGTIDTQYEDIAYQYLAKNGFPDDETDPEKRKVHCKVEAKGESVYDTVDSDDYIKAGYYKLTVWVDDDTFFAKMLDVDSLRLVKYSWVKADARYVAMPKALNYTVFAGSTKGTPSNPALQINGKTGGIVNSLTALTQNVMNGFNNWVVKPIQAFTFSAETWWNPSTWSVSFNWDNANSWKAKLYTSKLTTSGDVHSNSNIVSQIQSINANRIQDTDFEHSVSAVDLAKYFDMTPIEDVTPTFEDYGQVTFDAVKEITFKVPEGTNLLGSHSELDTYYYVQNQQYIEQTQLTLRVLDLIELSEITPSNFNELYHDAAELYLEDKVVTQAQKDLILTQASSGRLTYNPSDNSFTLTGQANIIYSVNAQMANNALDVAEEQGVDKMLFGTVEGDSHTYSYGLALVGNDVRYKNDAAANPIPFYAQRDTTSGGSVIGDEYDKRGDLNESVNFIKYNSEGDQTTTATANISGYVLNREYQDFADAGISVQPATKAGADFAIARTFIENSEYIEMPNLKPYFIRQINKSIRNATKIKENINVSSAGQPTIRYAAKERTDTLKGYQENLNYYDDTYKAADATALTFNKSNTMLFREFKESTSSGIINLSDTVKTYSTSTQDGLNYSYSISRYTYKGYNLYDGNNLRTPSKFYTDKLAERENTNGKKDGKQAVKAYYDSTAAADFNAVSTKKNTIKNNSGYKYDTKKNSVQTAINNEAKPTITTSAGSVTPKVSVTAPAVPDVFLGVGTTSSGVSIGRNDGIRKTFDNVLKSYSITVNNDTFTAPAQPGIGSAPSGGSGTFGGNNCSADQYTTANKTYSSATTPYRTSWGKTYRYNMCCNNTAAIQGDVKVDNGIGLYVQNGGNLRVGGRFYTDGGDSNTLQTESGGTLYLHGNVDASKSKTNINCSGYTHIGGRIYSDAENNNINVYAGGKLYINGNVEINDQKNNLNVWGYCQINGDLKTVKDGTFSSNTRNYHVYVKSGGVLVVKGNIDFTHTDYINVESGGTLIVQNQCTVNSGGSITVNGTFIQLNTGSYVDTSSLTVNGGKMYTGGAIMSKSYIPVTNGQIYCYTNVVANNDNDGDNYFDITGTSKIYIRGVLTTNGNKKHLYIHDGTNSVVSILGEGGSDCFNGTCSQIHANTSTSGNNIYLGKTTTIYDNNENIVNGGLSCFGNLTFNTTSQLTLTGTGLSYITGNFNATSCSLLNVTNNQTLYTVGNINVSTITVDNARVHSDGKITISGHMRLINGGLLEGVGGASASSYDTAGGDFNSVKTITFSGDINASAMSEGYVKTGNVSASSLTLNNVKLKIEGNLTLSGNINLSNNSVLYVTGNLSCAGITLDRSKLYVDGNTNCTKITEVNSSLFLTKKGNTVSTSSYSSVTCNGKISLASSSKLFCEGNLRATALDCAGSAKAYGYRQFNLTANYSEGNSGYFIITGSNSDVFCGPSSNISTTTRIDSEGTLFYPNTSQLLNLKRIHVTGGKVVIDGTEGSYNVLIEDWAYSGGSGHFVNFGKTKIKNCRFTNESVMLLVGGVDVTEASKTDMTGGNQQSDPDNFHFKQGSTSYLGVPYNGSTVLTNYTLNSNYEAWGDVYIDASLIVRGFMENKNPLIGGEKGGKDLYGTEGPRVGHLGISMYIPKGVTYVNGSVTTYADTSKDSAIHIGNYNKSNTDAGLVAAGDINLASAIYNYGKFEVRGSFNLNNTTKQKVTEKNDKDKYREGKSILNGKSEGETTPVFFVGNYDANGNIKNTSASVDFYGYIENFGAFYFNYNTVSIKGYNNEMSDGDVCGDFAFINFAGADAHFGGAVRLNSNQLFNKWYYGNNETIFTCDGRLSYGACLFNCGTVVAKGDITNNETNAETENSKKYVSDDHFSVMNGFTNLDKSVRENFSSRVYPYATIFCGGKMEVGVTEQGGESGSIISCGTMYVNGDMNVYTNASSFKLTLQNFTNFWKNPESHSYFRTALWLYDNSNTFVGGQCFAGAGVATGKDTIFMVGGDFRSKRSTKLGIQMFMGTSGALGITLLDDYMSYKENTGDTYHSAYFYVGGNALVNTIGSTVKAFGVVTAPENNSRDMDIYPNTNIYIGGSLYANCKVYMKDNVDMVVAGNKTFYDSSGNILSTIYSSMFTSPNNFVPEKNLSNGLTVKNHLNANKKLKFYVYQSFDMSPNASMVVNGAMQVNETSKIRDMTKSYVYGSFICGKYVELGKSLNDKDFSDIVDFDASGEKIAKDANGNYKFLSEEEKAYISQNGEAKFLSLYEFDKSAYMFVDGDYASGQDLGTGVLNLLDKIKKWITNTFLSTGYTKVYASSAIKVNGNFTSSRYITLRHDAKVYCKGDMDAATSIEGGVYTEWYVGGHMEAATSSTTQVIDAITGIFPSGLLNLTAQGNVTMNDQARVIVGGNIFSSANVEFGGLPSGAYTRGRKSNYTVQAPEGSNSYFETDSDFQEALILTYENGAYKDKSGAAIYLDGSTYKYSDYKNSDNKNIEFGSKDNVIVYVVSEGKYHSKTYDGDVVDYSDGALDQPDSVRNPDTNNGLDSTDEPKNFGAEVFCQGSLIALNGHIKQYAYTTTVVGDYVYAPDYITLRSNSDLWVLPEAFNNETYEFLPYPDKPEEHGNFFQRLWQNISYYMGKFAYETTENFKFQTGSVYTFGSLTVNKNASLMGTNDLLQLGTITHADDSPISGFETFLSQVGTFMNPRQVVLREDSLVLFGSNVTISSAPIALNLDVLKGNTSVAGFDSKGTAVYPGYQYKCTNHDKNGPHKGYNYTMTVDRDEHVAIQSGSETLTCDICGAEVNKNKYKIVQVSHPAVIFAGNSVYLSSTIDMLMTYIVADQGDVTIQNFYTKTAYDKDNLKELPNAVSSYNGDINYTAFVGQLSSLFYAPTGNIDFDGIYTDIYGSVIGNTVQMNAYYQNFHRFNNWRTMDLHVAESGSVYIIPEQMYEDAPELGQIYDLTSGTQYKDSPYGVRIFF